MVNYPVLNGTSGHLIGATLVSALVGPRLALLVMTTVLMLQALLFGDGGVSALGVNVLLMGVLPIATTAAVRRAVASFGLGMRTRTIAGVAAGVSVPVGALALAGIYAIGGQADVAPGALLTAMGVVHALIGIGEAAITVVVLSLVLAVAPGVAAWDDREPSRAGHSRAAATLLVGGVACSTALAMLASGNPDGLESVAIAYGLPTGQPLLTGLSFLSGYGSTAGTPVAAAGIVGMIAAAVLTAGAALIGSPRRPVRGSGRPSLGSPVPSSTDSPVRAGHYR